MERYTTLAKGTENLYIKNCPVLITANALVKDNNSDRVLAQLKFKNISDHTIKAVKVEIIPYSVENDELAERTEAQYLDLSAEYNGEFGQKQPIYLPDNTTRSFKIVCKSVIFADGKWENSENTTCEQVVYPIGIKDSISDKKNFSEFISFAEKEEIKNNTEIFWQKHNKEEISSRISFLKKNIVYASSELSEETNNTIEQYTKILSEERKADEDFSETETKAINSFDELKSKLESAKNGIIKKNSKKTKIIIATTLTTTVLVSVFIFIYSTIIVPELNYQKAINLMQNGDFDTAIVMFEELGDYKDSKKMITETENEKTYRYALTAFNNGYYSNAINSFKSIFYYKDSAEKIKEAEEKIKEAKYEQAMYYFNKENYTNAEELFTNLNFRDSHAMELYCKAKSAERTNIITAYNSYTCIASVYTDFKYINSVNDRIKLIKEYLPYTGTYTFTKGYGENAKYFEGDSRTVEIRISSNDQIKIYIKDLRKEYTLKKSDNNAYDYQFSDYYISKDTLYLSSSFYDSYFNK
ncbi:MAG: hypothetical protein IKV76_07235 [Clostridia bacterium]|nr:hypothetical protein [Clostridia bacterium]